MTTEHLRFLKKFRRRRQMVVFLRILILFLFLLQWEICADTGVVDSFIFSSPSQMLLACQELFLTGDLLKHIGITLAETFGSFFLVASISLLIAILLWWNTTLSEIFEPYFVILNSLPKSAMAPIFIVWLGNNMKTIIITAISVAIFGSILNLFTSFQTTDPDKLKLIYTLHGNRLDCLTKVILPINFPAILSILKVDIGLYLIGVVIGEFLAARKGLGYLIIYGSQVFKMDLVMTSVILLAIAATIMYKLITLLEKFILKKAKL